MEVGGVFFLFRIFDFLLIPIMIILSGFHFEYPQETHKWHMQVIDCSFVDEAKGVRVLGDDNSKFTNKTPLNHIPILGGWKNYVILEANDYSNYWYVGWKIKYIENKRPDKCEIHKLKIKSSQIKLLKGVPDSEKIFFALNKNGNFIKLKIADEGVLGDGKYRRARLF